MPLLCKECHDESRHPSSEAFLISPCDSCGGWNKLVLYCRSEECYASPMTERPLKGTPRKRLSNATNHT